MKVTHEKKETPESGGSGIWFAPETEHEAPTLYIRDSDGDTIMVVLPYEDNPNIFTARGVGIRGDTLKVTGIHLAVEE